MQGLENKRILVAGAASGIGEATARRLAAEGASLLLGDINAEGIATVADDLGARWAQFDLVEPASITELVARAGRDLGGLDGVANIAAALDPDTSNNDVDLLGLDIAVWQRVMNANLLGYALIMKEAIPLLLAAGGGSIVSVSSDAFNLGEPTRPAYAASKAGVNTLTRHVASKWGRDNIRANAVAPGVTVHEKLRALVPQEMIDQWESEHRLPRLGKPEDIAATIAFLLSDDAEWVTGQVWSTNGGHTLRD